MHGMKTVLAIGVCLLVSHSAMGGIVVYDNLGPDDSYGNGGDWIGNLFGQWVVVAAQFDPSASGNLDEITAAIWWGGEGVNQFTLKLLDDGDGEPGTTVLWEETFTGLLGAYGSVVTVSDLNGPTINPGTLYWLYCEAPHDGSTLVYWYNNNQNIIGCKARRDASSGDPWVIFCQYPQRAMRIIVEEEPSCPGDVDGDGDTDLNDLAGLLAAYGTSTGDPGYDPAADFDDNGNVDLSDLAFLLSDYGCTP